MLFVALAIAVPSYYLLTESLYESTQDGLLILAKENARAISSEMDEFVEYYFPRIVEDDAIKAYFENHSDEHLREFFSKFKNNFHTLTYIDSKGLERVKVSNTGSTDELTEISDSHYFRDAISSPGKAMISHHYLGQHGRPAIRLAMARLSSSGEPLDVIVGELPLSRIRGSIDSVSMGDKGFALLVDGEGDLLSNPENKKTLKKLATGEIDYHAKIEGALSLANGFSRAEIMGVDSYVASFPVEETDWRVIVALSYDEFRSGPDRIAMMVFIVAFFAVVCATIFSIRVSNSIVSPLRKLTEAANVIAEGDYDERVEIESKDEIGILASSFNKMAKEVKRTTHELQINNAELEKVVETRTNELRSANNDLSLEVKGRKQAQHEAEMATQIKSDFLANMSHEIRTPLTAIIGFAETTLDSKQTMEQRLAAIRSILRNGNHLLHIVNEILDISKIESGKLEIEKLPINIFEILNDVKSVMSLHAEEKGLHFEIDYQFPLLLKIITDEILFKQILFNLINNAIKFTEQGSVVVQALYHQKNKMLEIVVTDSGIGLSPENISKLFLPFSQADSSTTRKYGGTGLGLHISKMLAELLGGDISVESSPGMGSKFSLTIDCGRTEVIELANEIPRVRVAPVRKREPPALQGHILLAEDNPDNQRLISFYIGKTGAEVTTADNGVMALNSALEKPFDLILMDMQMPEMSGIEATRQLRKSGYTQSIVALTANASAEDKAKCLDAGCDDFLTKPIDLEKFYQTLSENLHTAPPKQQESIAIRSTILEEEPMMTKLVIKFLATLPGFLEKIYHACQELNQANVAELLHQLKGLGGSYGYDELTALAARMEFELKKGGLDEITQSLAELELMFSQMNAGAPATDGAT